MKLKITFPEERVKSPVLSEVVLKTGILVSIISTHVDSSGGEMIIEITDHNFETIKKELTERGASVTILSALILRNKNECVECGGCISVCPAGVFAFDKDWNLTDDTQKCIKCGLCIGMCPHQALSFENTEID
ncbi:MAG: 4Fe-4S binding protein [Methanimicrococcus sp.]|nr:4Fe-4S binding protein [Methanimicrococcus sp.]